MRNNNEILPQFVNVMVGTAGHIDHGKTQLVKRLTGCDTDRLKEEKERGMSIDLGFAPCKIGDNTWVGMVDVPGHEKFIRNMVAGVTGIDSVLLVIAADDGIMPQTREHFDIINLLGIKKGLVALNKIDLVEKDRIKEVVMQIKEFLNGTILQGCPIIPVSAVTGEGFDVLYNALSKVVMDIERKGMSGIFRMPVERKFPVKGIGTVVTGIPVAGKISSGEQVELLPQGIKIRVRGLQVFGRNCKEGRAGECVALNITGIEHGEIERGNALVEPGCFKPANLIKARLCLLKSCPQPLKNRTRISFYTGTSEVPGMVILLDKKIMGPGEDSLVQFQLDKPIVAGPRDKYIIRLVSPSVTIGGGMIIGELRARLKRFKPWIIENILKEETVIGNPLYFVEYALETTQQPWLTQDDLLKKTKLPLKKIGEILDILSREGRVVSFARGKKFVHQLNFAANKQKIPDFLKKFHIDNPLETGITRIELMKLLQFDTDMLDESLSVLLNEKIIVDEQNKLRLKEYQVKLNNEEKQLKEQVIELYSAGRFSTPRQEELPARFSVSAKKIDEMMNLLFDEGILVKLSQDVVMHKNSVCEAKEIVVKNIQDNGELDSAFFKNMIKSTRKYAIALLDYFDEQGLTVRNKNIRKLK